MRKDSNPKKEKKPLPRLKKKERRVQKRKRAEVRPKARKDQEAKLLKNKNPETNLRREVNLGVKLPETEEDPEVSHEEREVKVGPQEDIEAEILIKREEKKKDTDDLKATEEIIVKEAEAEVLCP